MNLVSFLLFPKQTNLKARNLWKICIHVTGCSDSIDGAAIYQTIIEQAIENPDKFYCILVCQKE